MQQLTLPGDDRVPSSSRMEATNATFLAYPLSTDDGRTFGLPG